MTTNHVVGVVSQTQTTTVAEPNPPIIPTPAIQVAVVPPASIAPALSKPALPKLVQQAAIECAGIDIGTMNIISAKQAEGKVNFKRIRDVFIDLTKDQTKMLKLSGDASYIEKGDTCYVLGDDAANIANIFGRKLRNPLNKGIISAGEIEAMEILKVMVGEVLGKPTSTKNMCYISSPGNPVDSDFDALYHQAVVSDIVASLGWTVKTVSESTALAFSECANNQFTGLCISCGHGMSNVSLVFKTIEAIKFSVSRAGSYLDAQAAKATGKTESQICAIKEKGIDLLNPKGKEQAALAVYYKHYIKYIIHHFIEKFRELQGNIELPSEIPCIVAGGTSMPNGFIDLVKQAINEEKGFPFPISEVKRASDPLNSIAKGLLIMAQNEG